MPAISSQYKEDLFRKLGFSFVRGKKLLDVGCGDGSDARIFIDRYGLETHGVDVYEDAGLKNVPGMTFVLAGIHTIPYEAETFDYIFLHDILHHVDEPAHRWDQLVSALRELRRVVKKDGTIIIVEGNRYNPLFYPHMVLYRGHEHFRQEMFIDLVRAVFPQAEFRFFESHAYPTRWLWFFRAYEWCMERWSPKRFLAYNVAIISSPYDTSS